MDQLDLPDTLSLYQLIPRRPSLERDDVWLVPP